MRTSTERISSHDTGPTLHPGTFTKSHDSPTTTAWPLREHPGVDPALQCRNDGHHHWAQKHSQKHVPASLGSPSGGESGLPGPDGSEGAPQGHRRNEHGQKQSIPGCFRGIQRIFLPEPAPTPSRRARGPAASPGHRAWPPEPPAGPGQERQGHRSRGEHPGPQTPRAVPFPRRPVSRLLLRSRSRCICGGAGDQQQHQDGSPRPAISSEPSRIAASTPRGTRQQRVLRPGIFGLATSCRTKPPLFRSGTEPQPSPREDSQGCVLLSLLRFGSCPRRTVS